MGELNHELLKSNLESSPNIGVADFEIIENSTDIEDGCDGAAAKRPLQIRDVKENPIYSELQSIAYKATYKGKTKLVMAHTRGNQCIGNKKLKKVILQNLFNQQSTDNLDLGSSSDEFQLTLIDDLYDFGGLEKAMVAPWIDCLREKFADKYKKEPIHHVIDKDVTERKYSHNERLTTNPLAKTHTIAFRAKILRELKPDLGGKVIEAEITRKGRSPLLEAFNTYLKTFILIGYGEEATDYVKSQIRIRIQKKLEAVEETVEDNKTGKLSQIKLTSAGTSQGMKLRVEYAPELEDIMDEKNIPEIIEKLKLLIPPYPTTILCPCNILPKHLRTALKQMEREDINVISMTDALQKGIKQFIPEQNPKTKKNGLILGGKDVSTPGQDLRGKMGGAPLQGGIYNRMQKPLKSRTTLTQLAENEALAIDNAMQRVNDHNRKDANDLLFNILKDKTDVDYIVIASTSISMLKNTQNGKVLDPTCFTAAQQNTVELINQIHIIDSLDTYIDHTVESILPINK